MAETQKRKHTTTRKSKQQVTRKENDRRIVVYPGSIVGEGWEKHVENRQLVSITDVLTGKRGHVAAVTTWGALISRMLRIDAANSVEIVCVGFDEKQQATASQRLKKWKNASPTFAD